jgi:hypothetical protein
MSNKVDYVNETPDIKKGFPIKKSIIKQEGTVPLIELFDQVMGVKVYQIGKGKPKQTNYEVENDIFITKTKGDSNSYPYISQGIKRYSYENQNEYINYGVWLAEPRDLKYFEGAKIVVREIINPRIFATYLDYPCVVKNIAAVIISKNTEISLIFLLGLLNSKLFTYYVFEQTPKSNNKSYPSFNSRLLKELPIKYDDVISLTIEYNVSQILELKQQDPNSDTTALEAEIDRLVYELYGLTEEEIEIVEKA